MDEPFKHRMKCYLDKTFDSTSTNWTCSLFPHNGIFILSLQQKKAQHGNEASNAAGLEITVHSYMDWQACTHAQARKKKIHILAKNFRAYINTGIIFSLIVLAQKHGPLHRKIVIKCFTQVLYLYSFTIFYNISTVLQYQENSKM